MKTFSAAWLVAITVVLVFGLAAIFVGPILLRRAQTRAVLAHGVPAKARVLNLKDTGTRINSQPLIAITLEVMPANKPPYKAVVKKVLTMADGGEFQRGTIIHVKYDPAHPERVAVVMPGC